MEFGSNRKKEKMKNKVRGIEVGKQSSESEKQLLIHNEQTKTQSEHSNFQSSLLF